MPAKDPNQYMKDRRAAEKAARQARSANEELTDRISREAFLEPLSASRYSCGCEPGNPCISHGIAKLSQKRRDAVLTTVIKGPRS